MTGPEQPTPLTLDDVVLATMVECERLGRHYSDVEDVLVIEIRTGRLQSTLRAALERFAAQRAAEAVEPWKRDCEAIVACLENERRMFMEKLKAATPPPGDAGHTVSLDFESRDDAERVFDRLERLKWIMSSGATLSLQSTAETVAAPPGDAGERARDVLAIAEQVHAEAIRDWKTEGNEADLDECIIKHFAAALQSERTGAASQAWKSAEIIAREKVATTMLNLSIATGHGDTIDDLLSELKAHILAAASQARRETLAPIVSALDLDGESHATDNLSGAIIDLEQRGADRICLKTLRRVRDQLAAVERALATPQARREMLALVNAALDWLNAGDALTAAKGDRLPANKKLTEAHIALRKAAKEYRALATPQESAS